MTGVETACGPAGDLSLSQWVQQQAVSPQSGPNDHVLWGAGPPAGAVRHR
jgi:hypothetical protein